MCKIRKIYENMVIGRGFGPFTPICRQFGRKVLRARKPVIRNKIFFSAQSGRYAGDPKYVCEALLKQGLDLDIVWSVGAATDASFPANVRRVKAGSFTQYAEMASAKVIVTDAVFSPEQILKLKKDQILIETWQGSYGLDRLPRKGVKAAKNWIKGAIQMAKMTKYCVTNSHFVSGLLTDTYWKKVPMREYGHPRNDIFFDLNGDLSKKLRDDFCRESGVLADTHLLLFAPTAEKPQTLADYAVDFDRLAMDLNMRFGGDWTVLLRYPAAVKKAHKEILPDIKKYKTKILDVSDCADMQELIAIADVAVTDHSDWIYDFLLRRKPGFIFASAVTDDGKAPSCSMEGTPFSVSADQNALEEAILSFEEQTYTEKVEAFLAEKGSVEDGHASERVADLIREVMDIAPQETDSAEDEEEIARRLLTAKMQAQTEEKKFVAPIPVFYIKGEKKTKWLDVLTEKTPFGFQGGVYTHIDYLRKNDQVVLASKVFYPNGDVVKGYTANYDNLDNASRESFFKGNDGNILVTKSGLYSLVYDVTQSLLTASFLSEETTKYTYYLNGNFNKRVRWGGAGAEEFRLRISDDVAVIENVYMKEGSVFFIPCIEEKTQRSAFAVGADCLLETEYAERRSDDNKLIRVRETGFYTVTFDPYSNLIEMKKERVSDAQAQIDRDAE